MRVLVLTLLLANLALTSVIYVTEIRARPAVRSADFNTDKMRLVPLATTLAANKTTTNTGPIVCLQWSGIAGADLQRAKDVIESLVPAEIVTETRVEGPVRYWVNIPPASNPSATVARLRAAGVKDVSQESDNSISLGLFSKEEMAQRLLAEIQNKGFAEAKIEARSPLVKEATLTIIKGVSRELAGKLGESKVKFAGSNVHLIDCPAVEKEVNTNSWP